METLTFVNERGAAEVFEPNPSTMSRLVEAKPYCNQQYLETGRPSIRVYNLDFCRPSTPAEIMQYSSLKEQRAVAA
jgi:hypothetical protein